MSNQQENTRQARIARLASGGIGDMNIATCDKCDSSYFYSVSVEQFNKGYSSVEYSPVGSNSKPVKVCICGHPLPSKATVRSVDPTVRAKTEEFQKSLDGARAHRDSNSASAVAKHAVSPKELEELKTSLLAKIKEVEDVLNALKPKEHKAEPKSSK